MLKRLRLKIAKTPALSTPTAEDAKIVQFPTTNTEIPVFKTTSASDAADLQTLSSPEGPCTQIVYTLAFK